MARLAFGFKRRDATSAEAATRVAAMVRSALGLAAADSVTVSEIACPDPACPGDETVILVMRAGRRTQAAKLRKAMAQVEEADLAEALADLRG